MRDQPQEPSVLAVVQARMSSTRLPGKVLADLAGAPMLQRQLERVSRAVTLSGIVVATSSDDADDPIEELCEHLGIACYRGDLTNVLSRFIGVIAEHQPDVVVRITADCPLMSPVVIDSVVEAFLERGGDYLSNTLQPSFPDGLDVEVVRASALVSLAESDLDQDELEHVTLGIYRRPAEFIVNNFVGEKDLSNLRWTVDSPEDLEFVRWVYGELFDVNPDFDVLECVDLLAKHPQRSRTGADARRNAALDGLDTGAMRH